MARVRDVLHALETIAPPHYAASWDRIGLQVGDANAEVTSAVVTLDRSLAAVAHAQDRGAQLLVAHHPLIFAPLERVDTRRHDTRTILELAKSNIAFVAAHTNWDAAKGGINDVLAGILMLEEVEEFGFAAPVEYAKLVTFAPPDAVESIVDSLTQTSGVGVIEGYRRCAFRTGGEGSYVAPDEVHLTRVREERLEVRVPVGKVDEVVRRLIAVHPYRVPAYDVTTLRPVREQPAGRVGRLAAPTTFAEFVNAVDGYLDTRSWAWGSPDTRVRKVAVVGGAADSEWMAAQRTGADVLLTGEVKQHVALEAVESGMCLIAAGHYATEQPGVVALAKRLSTEMPEVNWQVFEPAPGGAGRPQ